MSPLVPGLFGDIFWDINKKGRFTMKELKILYLYPDILELYGDYGNIQILCYRLEQRGFKAVIDPYSIGDTPPDFKSYDLVFARAEVLTKNKEF